MINQILNRDIRDFERKELFYISIIVFMLAFGMVFPVVNIVLK